MMQELRSPSEKIAPTAAYKAIQLLKQLISVPSFSKEEDKTADCIQSFLEAHGVKTFRKKNNVWASNKFYSADKPSLLLNSHHDTVKPNRNYTKDPFSPDMEGGKLFGLGSNDAGGSIVCMALTFLNYYEKENLPYNLVYAATAEEEISGHNGLELIIPELGNIACAIVGEPTKMDIAVAEKGLLVLDCVAHGVAGHAARDEGDNAIYKAVKDISWFSTFQFPKISPHLGKVKMNVTIVQGGSQHNVIPGTCCYTVDIRVTDVYTHEEILAIIKENVVSEITPRSTRLRSSSVPESHPLVRAGVKAGRKTYGSPTSSDQALLAVPSIKMGPGDSVRSHTADEFIYVKEIKEGISIYTKLIDNLFEDHKSNQNT